MSSGAAVEPSYGLDDKVVEKIRAVFSHYPGIEQAILYGSRAKGNYRNGSDIDLTFIGNGLSPETLYRLDQELDELLLPYTFDLSLFTDIDHQGLRDHIARVGKVFYRQGADED